MIAKFLWINFLLFFHLTEVICGPVRSKLDSSKLIKNEKLYPNGTVEGKYSYTDKNGNPIQLKYYADDASYGVELKSLKVMTGTSDNPMVHDLKVPNEDNLSSSPETALWALSDISNPTKTKTDNTFEVLKKEISKPSFYKTDHKSSPEYDIYFQNDLVPSNKCEKVRVYLEKEMRKTRSASFGNNEVSKYCDQF